MASLGIRTIDELIGRTDLLEADDGDRPLEGARRRPRRTCSRCPELPEGAPLRRVEPPPPVLDDALDWELVEAGRGARSRRGEPVALERPVRNVNRCVGGILSSHDRRAPRRRGPAGGHDRRRASRGSAGQSLRRLAGAGRDVHAARRRQRLHRQGPVRRHARRHAARRRRPTRAEENVIDRQHRALRRDERQGVLPRPGRRALRGAQLGRERRRRGRRRPRLRVHDRRARRRPRPDRAQLRRRHERRPGVRARRGRQRSAARVNPTMLDQLEPLDEADAIEVRALVAEHVERTGSPVGAARARRVGRRCCRSFVKVFPTDYKRVLAELAAAEAAASNGARRARTARRRRRRRAACDRGGRADGRARRLPEDRARRRPVPRPDRARRSDYKEFLVQRPDDELRGAGRALHGVRRAVLPQRLPARAT